MRVLYVEDNPANVFLVKRVARMGNHEIINYIDGSQALRKYDEINPDLVLMDIQLAGDKTGLDVVRELRARGIKTKIIAVTAYAMVGDKERCIEAGCDDYLAKPLPIPRLVEIFESHSKLVASSSPAKVEAPKVEAVVSPEVKPETVVAPTPEAKPEETPKAEASPVPAPVEEKPKAATAPLVETVKPEVKDAVETVVTPPDAKVEDKPEEESKTEANTVSEAKIETSTTTTTTSSSETEAESTVPEIQLNISGTDGEETVKLTPITLTEAGLEAKPVEPVSEVKPSETPSEKTETSSDVTATNSEGLPTTEK